jgi:hypothetical protein
MNRPEVLDLLQRYHPLPGEIRELGALVRAAPNHADAAYRAKRVLWAEYPTLWAALERHVANPAIIYAALSLAFGRVDPWLAFVEMLTPWPASTEEAAGRVLPPLHAAHLKPPALLLHNVTGTAEPTFEVVDLPGLAAVPDYALHARWVGLIVLDPEYDLEDKVAALRAMQRAITKKASGDHPDYELLLQLYVERRLYPSLSDTKFCDEVVRGWKGVAAWPTPPADVRTVQRALSRARRLFERLTPDRSLASLLAEVC